MTRLEKEQDNRFRAACRDVRMLRDLELAELLDEFARRPKLEYAPIAEEAARRLGLRP